LKDPYLRQAYNRGGFLGLEEAKKRKNEEESYR
jgi:hypothetical protein